MMPQMREEHDDARIRPTVVIADDHLLMAQGLAKLLADDFEVVAAVGDPQELLTIASERIPDLALIDVCMPELSGMETTRQLRQAVPQCKVILISMYAHPEFVREAFFAGASGYLLKSAAATELREAIREVLQGKMHISSCIAKDVLARLLAPAVPPLSQRQREVLALVANGYTAKEIAYRLEITVKTAQFHKIKIMEKLGVHTTAELTKYALGRGIVS
jgi:DNA-binding NarL/FixJ family response regulator